MTPLSHPLKDSQDINNINTTLIPYLGPRLFTKDQNGRRLLNKCVTWALLSYQTTSGICINVCLNVLHNHQESIMFKFRGSWWQSCYCIGAFATRISEKSSNTTTTTILIVRISCLFSLIGWESSSPQKLVPRLLSPLSSWRYFACLFVCLSFLRINVCILQSWCKTDSEVLD